MHAEQPTQPQLISSLSELQQLVPEPETPYRLELRCDLLWAGIGARRLLLGDSHTVIDLEADLPVTASAVGRHVELRATGLLLRRGLRLRLLPFGPVVDNNGIHAAAEKTGAVYLPAGVHPLRLTWFNGRDVMHLRVELTGPGLTRREIPPAMLYLPPEVEPTDTYRPGLIRECYEWHGEALPEFELLHPVQRGIASGFDLADLPFTNNVAVRFSGLIKLDCPGVYRFHLSSDDGSQLFVGRPELSLKDLGPAGTRQPEEIMIGQVLPPGKTYFAARTRGRITKHVSGRGTAELELASGTKSVTVLVGNPMDLPATGLLGRDVLAHGICIAGRTTDGLWLPATIMVPDANHIVFPETPAARTGAETPQTNLLTTAVAVQLLKRDQAQARLPTRLRGVVTCVLPEHQAFTMHDNTRGIYVVDMTTAGHGLPEPGDELQVEGHTDAGLFAPVVNATNIVVLGPGKLPDPVAPTWDQLLNGSLDAQFVELRGVVTTVASNTIMLRLQDGTLAVELRPNNMDQSQLPTLRDALVRLRGCLFASWDYVTHQVRPGEIRLYNTSVYMEEPPPTDPFAAPEKRVNELAQFDPTATAFKRVKIIGQAVHCSETMLCVMQDGLGARVLPRVSHAVEPGDLVEVVGFPELTAAPAPVLGDALVRKLGHAPLPAPKPVSPENLLAAENDATLVELEATLAALQHTRTETLLELHSQLRSFMARLPRNPAAQRFVPGSRLHITGVYLGHGTGRTANKQITTCELIVPSVDMIRVLARPPWLTFQKLLYLVGLLAGVLCLAAIWITQLHRRVEQRTAELAVQIQERQRAEQKQWLERERARIAQDLHDELGSGITEISMLALRAQSDPANADRLQQLLGQIYARARELVTALDEIVWAMNPAHDSVGSVLSYLSLYAERFLEAAGIRCHIGAEPALDRLPVTTRVRHELFMACREALNNIARHAHANNVNIRFETRDQNLAITISDDGRGFDPAAARDSGNGLANMRARMNRIGGTCQITSSPGAGATVVFTVPVADRPNPA